MKKELRSEKIKQSAKNCVTTTFFLTWSICAFIIDFISWVTEGSVLSGLLALGMAICVGFEFYFLKNEWNRLHTLCLEIRE